MPLMPSHTPAHPRSRGENRDAFERFNVVGGSSPLTRGKLLPPSDHAVVDRLIPAHAGKTWSFNSDTGVTWAHPRSRGENGDDLASGLLDGGSSPLTRGKLEDVVCGQLGCRLIPAHAGKTLA